jgi:hypothetical protein
LKLDVRLVGVDFALLGCIVLAGCVGETGPLRYNKGGEQREWVGTELLEEATQSHWARDAVIKRLGMPDAEFEATRTIGYLQCRETKSVRFPVLIIPLPIPSSSRETALCQMIKLRIDTEGTVAEWGYCGPLVFDHEMDDEDRVSLRRQLDEWLAGASCEGAEHQVQ